ncbi:MAG: fasciclin domain-containing protein [Saprospiraceae bacterium]|nr:fasciclin domain-containing protein [Saprospiraceae bacterium]
MEPDLLRYFADRWSVTVADINADNGVVHVINAVLLPPKTVADIVIGSSDHNTLEAALGAAGLVNTLNGAGPYTVFAPTDGAFSALPAGTVEALLADPGGALTDILLYHVVGAKALSTDLSNDQRVVTLEDGKTVKVTINADGVFINNARVTVADINADNGVVHVINAVLLPPKTVADIIKSSTVHTILNGLLEESGLDVVLNGAGQFTVFAPTDEAFEDILTPDVTALLENNPELLELILKNHVLSGRFLSSDLSDGQGLSSLGGLKYNVTINNSGIFIYDDSKVTAPNLLSENGVVHVIDKVLIEKIAINTSDDEISDKVTISPNPANDSVQLEIDHDDLYTVELISLSGQVLMKKENILNQLKIDLDNVQSGLYFVKLSNQNTSMVKKLFRQ